MTALTHKGSSARAPVVRAEVFWCFWAVAHLVHLWLQYHGRLETVPAWFAFLAALALLRRPSAPALPAVLAVAQLMEFFSVQPLAADHWVLVAACNIAILATYLVGRRGAALLSTVAPMLRVLVLVAYSAAAIAKWNTSFLDPVASCAAFISDSATFGLAGLVPGSGWASVVLSISVESAVPILLLIPRTRNIGARLGITFHVLLSLSPVVSVEDFTFILIALFGLFLAPTDVEAAIVRGRAMGRRVLAWSDIARWFAADATRGVVALAVCGGAFGFYNTGLSRLVLWLLANGLAVTIVLAIWSGVGRWGAQAFGRPPIGLIFVPLLLLAWAASPYVGGRTTGVFTMFSNLRTEMAADNHPLHAEYRPVRLPAVLGRDRSTSPAMMPTSGPRTSMTGAIVSSTSRSRRSHRGSSKDPT